MFRLAANLGKGQRFWTAANNIKRRPLVTLDQKRILNEKQLGNSNEAVTDNVLKLEASSPDTFPPPNLAGNAFSGGGGRSAVISIVVAVGFTAVGAYYFDLIPAEWVGKDGKTSVTTTKKERPIPDFTAVARAEIPIKNPEPKDEIVDQGKILASDKIPKKDIPKNGAFPTKREDSTKTSSTAAASKREGNRVTQIMLPSVDRANRFSKTVVPVQHAPDGHRVTIDKVFTSWKDLDCSSEDSAGTKEKEKETASPVAEEQPKSEKEIVKIITSLPSTSTAADAVFEPKPTFEDTANVTSQAAQTDSYFDDLENLNYGQLKVRVNQLVDELNERTKWEALRLKEFLAIKEKEVVNEYLEMLQKQKLEFEDLMARRLREQEDNLSRQANTLLQSKEDLIQSVVSTATEAQRVEHEVELQSTSVRFMRDCEAKYEAQAGTIMANAKNEFAKELEAKVKSIEELTAHLRKLEHILYSNRNFESGSQRAHRVSASALALTEKMETSMGAAEEFDALQAASAENGVIASALSVLPASVKLGIPTISELQTKFVDVHTACRRAALVPEGRVGLGGQLAGILFAALSVPPSPEAVSPPSLEAFSDVDAMSAEYILARALRFVRLGDLEPAVKELNKLKGQVAFAVKDWKQDALDRIAVHHTLKVIKMECALMNKNMSNCSQP